MKGRVQKNAFNLQLSVSKVGGRAHFFALGYFNTFENGRMQKKLHSTSKLLVLKVGSQV